MKIKVIQFFVYLTLLGQCFAEIKLIYPTSATSSDITIWADTWYTGSASYAIDNNPITKWTLNNMGWIQVDLGKEYDIHGVSITYEGSTSGGNIANIYVDGVKIISEQRFPNDNLTFSSPIRGRIIKYETVAVPHNDYLQVATWSEVGEFKAYVATEPESTSTNTAEIKAYGIHAALLPATASHGGTIYFTSYDGVSTYPLNDQNAVSSEFKPASDGSSVFRADYMVGTESLGVYEYGTISLNMPTADTDSNQVFDWLQKDMAVDATFSGHSEVHWLASGAISDNANITGRIIRSAGASSGTYSTTYSISGVTFTAQGTWWVGYWSGNVSYEGGNYSVSITTTDSTGATRNLTGSASYSNPSESQLQFSDITLKEGSDELIIRESTLNRSLNIYSARFKAVDGDPKTSWSDFVDWHVVLTDRNDADSDGVPDFSDGDFSSTDSSSGEASSSSDDLSAKLDRSWAWFKYPWIYNDSVESWCYLHATSDGHFLWCYKNSSWYSWDKTNAVWVKN